MRKFIHSLFIVPLFFVVTTQTFAADSVYVDGTTEASCIGASRLLDLDLSGTPGCGSFLGDPSTFYAGNFDISSIPAGMDLKSVTVKFWVNNTNEDNSVHYTPTLIVNGNCSVTGEVIEPTLIHWEEVTRRFDISSCNLTSSTDSIEKVQITRNNTSGGGAIDYIALKVTYSASAVQTYSLNDRSPYDLNLTNYGTSSVAANLPTTDSQYGTDFEASSTQKMTAPDGNSLNQADITVETWIKFESLPSSGSAMSIVEKKDTFGFRLENDSGTYKLRAIESVGNGSGVAVPWTPSTNVWYHVSYTYDSNTTTLKFYVNGTQQGSTVTSGYGPINYDSTGPLTIGAFPATGGDMYFFDGVMDDLRIWNVARTSTQINQDMNLELYGSLNTLSAYYPFESF